MVCRAYKYWNCVKYCQMSKINRKPLLHDVSQHTGTGGTVPILVAQHRHWWCSTRTGDAVCKGATPSVKQPGRSWVQAQLRSLLD